MRFFLLHYPFSKLIFRVNEASYFVYLLYPFNFHFGIAEVRVAFARRFSSDVLATCNYGFQRIRKINARVNSGSQFMRALNGRRDLHRHVTWFTYDFLLRYQDYRQDEEYFLWQANDGVFSDGVDSFAYIRRYFYFFLHFSAINRFNFRLR